MLTGTHWQVFLYLKNLFVIEFQNNLSQLNHTPTHLKSNILDLVLTNADEHISNVEMTPSMSRYAF